jgi:type II secretory ATPase GspE/PulE/Tfp pilus assembly ATPase PilB-like protein
MIASATIDLVGGFISLPKLLTVLVLAWPGLVIAPWVQRDARRILAPATAWASVVLGAGVLGVILWLFVGNFWLGMLLYIFLASAAPVGYVVYRNARVDAAYRVLTREHIKRLMKLDPASNLTVETKQRLYNSDGKPILIPDGSSSVEQRRAYNLAQSLMNDVLFHRASEADMSPVNEEIAKLRFLIDGVVVEQPEWDLSESELVIQYLKSIGGMDVNDTRRPQKGQVSADLAGQVIDMALTTTGTRTGQRIQFRVVQESIQMRLTDLGLDKEMLPRLEAMNSSGPGLILVAARGRNGQSSTLYSLLNKHDAFTQQVVTFEAKAASELPNVTQNIYAEPADLLPSLVRIMRQEPDVLMVDNCPDAQTAAKILDIAEDKPLILGINAADSLTALAKWVQTVGDPSAALKPLKAVVSQVLVRKLCPDCKEGYSPDPTILSKLNLTSENIRKLYRPPSGPRIDEKGKPIVDKEGNPIPCPTCRGTGYFGRTGVFELLELTDEIAQTVAKGGSLAQIKAVCRKNNMQYLQENALAKVIRGITSVPEVVRVTQAKKKA